MSASVLDRVAPVKFPRLGDLVLILGLGVLLIPTVIGLMDQSWSQDFGAYGPIVLVTGGWLLWRKFPEILAEARPGNPWLTGILLLAALTAYLAGSTFGLLTFQVAGVYGVGLAMLQSRVGTRVMMTHWFPLLYLGFVIPPPGSILADVTAPLKHLVSLVATDWLAAFGLPVSREGVTIFVAQYQLLVEDACSGMNSIVGLIAISLLYIYLVRGSSIVYSVILSLFVIPVAIVTNILRIMVLVLLTYGFGNEVGQGFLHVTAGMFLFVLALLFVFGLDKLFTYIQHRLSHSP
jgi:exosortase